MGCIYKQESQLNLSVTSKQNVNTRKWNLLRHLLKDIHIHLDHTCIKTVTFHINI